MIYGDDVAAQADSTYSSLLYTTTVELRNGDNYEVEVLFSSAKNVSNHLVLEEGSNVKRGAYTNDLTFINAVFTGSLECWAGYFVPNDYDGGRVSLVSGQTHNIDGNLFQLNVNSETTLTSLTVTYGRNNSTYCQDAITLEQREGSGLDYEVGPADERNLTNLANFTSLAKNSYKNIIYDIPTSIKEGTNNTVSMLVYNPSGIDILFRVDVESDVAHQSQSQSCLALNTSATFNDEPISTDTVYGGSSVTISSQGFGLLKIHYNTIHGALSDLKIYVNSSQWDDDDSYGGFILFGNVCFKQESLNNYTLACANGEGGPYTCTNKEGISIVTYESVTKATYRAVYAWMGTDLAGASTLTLTIKSNVDYASEFQFGLNDKLTDATQCDYFNSGDNHRAQFGLGAYATRTLTLVFDPIDADALLEIRINSTWEADTVDPHTVLTNGNFEILNVSIA